jgi:methyl-accepting chemotaxis protein
MLNKVGSGRANGPDAKAASAEATRMALEGLAGGVASFGFVFASPTLSLSDCLRAAEGVARGAKLIGCTTAGEFTERGLVHGGVSVLLVRTDSPYLSQTARGVAEGPASVAKALCDGFHPAAAAARQKGFVCSTTVTLVDGLSGAGERFVESMVESTQALHQVVGGAAGDEGKFAATHVGEPERSGTDMAAALHVFTRTPWGIGIGHGLEPTSAKMRVTKAKKNVVQEIDGRPAFSVYEEHARQRGVTLTPATAGEYLIANELGIIVAGKVTRARAPLSVGADGSLSCAAEVPQGSYVAILDGKPDAMVAAASQAAEEALQHLQGQAPAGILLFDCVCRGLILKQEFQREIDAVRSVAGEVPVAGFLTYGEIASYSGRIESWHNTTAVALAIPR